MGQQSVGPNAEDLSLILGHGAIAARGRSFSTTMNPKATGLESGQSGVGNQSKTPTGGTPLDVVGGSGISPGNNSHSTTTAGINSGSEAQNEASQTPGSRKKSVPQSQREKSTASAEDFFIDVILQRHARRLLQEKRFIDLGYMSAALDFHLVGWLSREKERAARIEDFVVTLKQLHEDLQWPKPDLDLKLSSVSERASEAQDSPSYSLQSLRLETNIETGDSGYTSLPPLLESRPLNYDPMLAQLALKNMNLLNGDGAGESRTKERSMLMERQSQRQISEASEVVSSYMADEEDDEVFQHHHRSTEERLMANSAMLVYEEEGDRKQNKVVIPHRLDVKVRYLLQIFTEANCLEVSLLLSVLLMDTGSISRITNAATRNGSLQLCRQLRNGLKDMTRWSFQECLGYRAFFINLQPQIYQLDSYVLHKEAIPFPAVGAMNQLGQGGGGGSGIRGVNVGVRGQRSGSVDGETTTVPFKRSDSVRSTASIPTGGLGGLGGLNGRPKENGLLRKSKTELVLATNNKARQGGNKKETTSHEATSERELKKVVEEQSNCVVM